MATDSLFILLFPEEESEVELTDEDPWGGVNFLTIVAMFGRKMVQLTLSILVVHDFFWRCGM